MITPISASFFPQDDDFKTDEYRLLNMLHQMAGSLANSNKKEWWLKSTATFNDYVMTTWSNGIVDIKAQTWKDYLGNPVEHAYSMYKCEEKDCE